MACARISGCPLYKAFAMKSSLRVWKTYYARATSTGASGSRSRTRARRVPPNMLPNGRMLEVPINQYDAN